jgi:hypothetical protein
LKIDSVDKIADHDTIKLIMLEVLAGTTNFDRGSSPLQNLSSSDQDFSDQLVLSKTVSKLTKGQALSSHSDGLKVELLKVLVKFLAFLSFI